MPILDDFLSHSIATLERALEIRKRIDQLNEKLKEFAGPKSISLGAIQIGAGKPASKKGRGKMSSEGRARIAAAQRARWAKQKGTEASALKETPKAKKKRGGLSAEGRARIAEAQRRRWAKANKGR
jgi:hypothetical protein